jgi:hypothetical protein
MPQVLNGPNVITHFVPQGIICKHVIKIYKMLNPTILDGVIV